MFGFGGMFGGGGGAGSPFARFQNSFAGPSAAGQPTAPGQGSAYPALGQFGSQIMQQAAPRFAGVANPSPQGFPAQAYYGGGMPPAGGLPFNPMGGGQGQIPPWLLQHLQAQLGPTSEAGWGMGTTTTPTPSRWSTPSNLIGSFFNRGGYQ